MTVASSFFSSNIGVQLTKSSEVQLLRFYEPKPGLFIAESPKVIQRAANAGYQPVSFLVQHKDLEKEGKAAATISRELASIKAFFSYQQIMRYL